MKRWKTKQRVLQPGLQHSTRASATASGACCMLNEQQGLLTDARTSANASGCHAALRLALLASFNRNGLWTTRVSRVLFFRGTITVLRNICYVPKWEFYYTDFFKERNMQTKGGIRKRPQRRRGTLPVPNSPAVTLQKLLYLGTPLCRLEVKDTVATPSLTLDGGENICFGAREKWVQNLVPLLILGENLPLRLHPLRGGTSPAGCWEEEWEGAHRAGTGPGR